MSRMNQSPYNVPRKIPMEKIQNIVNQAGVINLRESLPLPMSSVNNKATAPEAQNHRIAMEIAKARSRSEMGVFP